MQPHVLARGDVAGCRLEAVLGDMTSERVDAIVNAANTNLAHGGGLAGAIVARGGAVTIEELAQGIGYPDYTPMPDHQHANQYVRQYRHCLLTFALSRRNGWAKPAGDCRLQRGVGHHIRELSFAFLPR